MTQKLEVVVEYYPHTGINYGVSEEMTIDIPLDELTEQGGDVEEWIQQNEAVQFEWAFVSIKVITEEIGA